MANQPTKYRKFVVGAASAALVASAVAPVASAATKDFSDIKGNTHEDAIKALVEKGVINGYEDGTFKPNKTLTRSDVVKMMGKWLVSLGYEVPADYKTKPRFTDQTSQTNEELLKYSAVVKDNGVFNGYENGSLGAAGEITRENMALVLVRAFDTINNTDLVKFVEDQEFKKDVVDRAAAKAEARPYIDVLDYFDITNPAAPNFRPKETTTRGQFATFLHKTSQTEVPATEAKVESVKALNASTLTVTGTGLKALKAEDITVEDNEVSEVTAAEDGKTATVKLKNPLVVNVPTKVTVKAASFDVTYKIEATGVKIAEGQFFDDDTEKQFVQILVDGKAVTAQELITAGYTVEFEATDRRSGGAPANIFRDASATSTTGELDDEIDLDGDASADYYVTVTLTKGSDVFVTPNTKITVKNLDSVVNSITHGVIAVDSDSTFDSQFTLASSTLAAGDTAKFAELHASVGGTKEVINLTGLDSMYSVKSSDESIISVNKADHTLTAEGPGTATITVTYGGATYTKTLTVKSEKRKIASAKLSKTSLNVGIGATATGTFKVQIVDQYGDPVNAAEGDDFTVHSSDATVATASVGAVSTDGRLEHTVNVKGVDTGTADFTVRNAANTRIGSSVRVNVTENVTASKYNLTVDNAISAADVAKVVAAGGTDATKNNVSTTTTIDTGDTKYVKIDVAALNSANQQLPAPKAGADYNVTAVNASDSNVLDNTFGNVTIGTATANGVYQEDDYLIVKAGSNNGTVTITITDANNSNVKQTIKLTVTDKGVTVTKVAFKNISTINYATTLDFEDFLSYTKSSTNYNTRINGLTLSRTYSQAVRLSETNESTGLNNVDTLYIDLNGNGQFDDTDTDLIIGYAGMGVTGDVYDQTGTLINVTATAADGYDVGAGSDGTVIFRVYNDKEEIVATKAVKVDF